LRIVFNYYSICRRMLPPSDGEEEASNATPAAINFANLLVLFKRSLSGALTVSKGRGLRVLGDRGLRLADVANIHRCHGDAVPDPDGPKEGEEDDGAVTCGPDLTVWDEGWD
jgi:hypothetical protein